MKCPYCGKNVPNGEVRCPHCKAEIKAPKKTDKQG